MDDQWEYLTVDVKEGKFASDEGLDALGEKDWELVTVSSGKAYFKRPTTKLRPEI